MLTRSSSREERSGVYGAAEPPELEGAVARALVQVWGWFLWGEAPVPSITRDGGGSDGH